MSVRDDAEYAFSVKAIRVFALNDDKTQPSPSNIIGGVGPFDMSGLTPASVDMSIKVDTAAAVDFTVDISAAANQAAVTVDEAVTAIQAAITAGTLPITVTKDVTSGRIKIASTGTPKVLQVYGDFAEAILIGQGFGVKYIKSNTIKSIATTELRKDDEIITNTDANGIDVEVHKDGYHKGENGTIVDTAEDWNISALLSGKKIESDGSLSTPTSTTKKPFVHIDSYYSRYRKGISDECEVIGYVQESFFKCKGMSGDSSRDRNLIDSNYTFTSSNYVEGNVEKSSSKKTPLTVAQYEALHVLES